MILAGTFTYSYCMRVGCAIDRMSQSEWSECGICIRRSPNVIDSGNRYAKDTFLVTLRHKGHVGLLLPQTGCYLYRSIYSEQKSGKNKKQVTRNRHANYALMAMDIAVTGYRKNIICY